MRIPIFTYIYHKSKPNVGKYTMEHMGYIRPLTKPVFFPWLTCKKLTKPTPGTSTDKNRPFMDNMDVKKRLNRKKANAAKTASPHCSR